MKKRACLIGIILTLILTIGFVYVACDGMAPDMQFPSPPGGKDDNPSIDDTIYENPVIDTSQQNDYILSVDVHTANYSLLKNLIFNAEKQYYDAEYLRSFVKIDEMINYFDYDYARPENDELLAMNAAIFDSPYNPNKKMLSIGLAAKEVELNTVSNNIVLLLDVSGSMNSPNKIGLMKSAMIQMVDNLNPHDKISIVTYSNSTRTLVDGLTIANDSQRIKRAINDLRADGGTNGEGGIQRAYEVAQKHYIPDGNNRVILATDGDFNIGISDPGQLKEFISTKKDNGVYITCVGLGSHIDYSLRTMEVLAKSGNGYWGYIGNMEDAKKLLVDDLGSTIVTLAKDVKAKIEFDKNVVKNFRLLGYENSRLSQEDFDDSQTDAGEIGSNFTISLCFEIELHEDVDLNASDLNVANINIRYKDAKATNIDPSLQLDMPIGSASYTQSPTQDNEFIGCVAEFAMIVLNSKFKSEANIDNVLSRLEKLQLQDESKQEFLRLVKHYKHTFL